MSNKSNKCKSFVEGIDKLFVSSSYSFNEEVKEITHNNDPELNLKIIWSSVGQTMSDSINEYLVEHPEIYEKLSQNIINNYKHILGKGDYKSPFHHL